jgi:hypothetical protein
LVNVIATVVIAFGTIAGIIYGLDRGIFIGSTSFVSEGLLHKTCRYVFVTGISDLPAPGGPLETGIAFRGVQLANAPDNLYCRFFGE